MSTSSLHWSRQYDQDLESIRSKVLLMGGLAEEQFKKALKALDEGNISLAEEVMATDEQINQLQVSLDNACTELLVRRQPAAQDLRTVVATMKILTDIERVGDEAVKVARAAKNILARNLVTVDEYRPIYSIAATAGIMLQDALDAYARLDRDKAIRMMALDAAVDQAFHDLTRSLMTYMMEEPKMITSSLEIMFAAKAIERIADHATNIGEYIIYVLDGDDIRHSDYARRVMGIVR